MVNGDEFAVPDHQLQKYMEKMKSVALSSRLQSWSDRTVEGANDAEEVIGREETSGGEGSSS